MYKRKMFFTNNIQKIKQQHIDIINHAFIILLFSLLSLLILIYFFFISTINQSINLNDVFLDKKINVTHTVSAKHQNVINLSCNFFTCFNIYCCGHKGKQLLVYVYPQKRFNSDTSKANYLTKEFYSILNAITESDYYTSNPNEACIFVPSIDMLYQHEGHAYISHNLNVLKFLKKGKNHLIFNLIEENQKTFNRHIEESIGQAMIAGIGHLKSTYRRKFDISLPTFSNLLDNFQMNTSKSRTYMITSAQLNVNPYLDKELLQISLLYPDKLLILNSCARYNITNVFLRCTKHNSYKYPDILQTSIFCLVLRGETFGLSILLESLATNCIPVIIFDSMVMPFDEVIDWSRAAVFIRETDIHLSVDILNKYSLQRIKEFQHQGMWLYTKYFQSIKLITKTTLDIIADRIFPSSAKNYYFWNEPQFLEIVSPVFLPVTIPKNDGFTAVILTYDRIDLLFLLIHRLSKVPSLSKVLIVWNNEKKKPPRISKWPKIHKLIKIIQTNKNILSNRFYPFDEIETEAVLSIDDDIIMLTEDEIEFAFEVWREFPDRIVGFPSRTHAWDNKTACWKYESEWTNHVSMVLTGAAFYHKYWNYIYTTKLPEDIKNWVDKHMNCEDIAMNFLVSNITRKAPIKVTAKKKFRCPECINSEMLSADLTHMVERTQCINEFIKIFGYMPLLSIEFRADPVLFKDNFPDKLKRFNNVGNL